MRALVALSAALLLACPTVNSRPCNEDTECEAGRRCRRGACGPICLNDGECGSGQACVSGRCDVRPECAIDTDCASGFTCAGGRCRCQSDGACAANQTCTSGVCQARTRCRMDAECMGGTRCEVTQGLCIPACRLPQDCAPNLDPQVAFALYACVSGTCSRRCSTDVTCAADGVVCKDSLCVASDCRTRDDCPANQYCTSGTFGRCVAFKTCSSSSECDRNSRCERFGQNECPPGFDCSLSICRELPRCFIDSDCVSGVPGTMAARPNGFCDEGFCQPTDRCLTTTSCTQGRQCIGGICVPPTCRGHADCGPGKACVATGCIDAPAPTDLARLGVSPEEALLPVGDTLQLSVIGYRLDQSTFPLSMAAFTVLDEAGMPSANVTVTPGGLVTALAPGVVRVKVEVMMSFASPVEVRLRVYPRVTTGRRVVVLDAPRRRPLAGALVRGCLDPDCQAPLDAMTDPSGVASFPQLGAGRATFTAVSPATRSDGRPTWERVSILSTTAPDVLIPLRENPVRASSGFNGTVAFQQVRTSGTYWLGLIATSIGDLPGQRIARLVGDPVFTEIQGINQRVPLPGAAVVYTSPALNIPTEVKPRSLGFGQPGERAAVAFATRGELNQLATLRSVDLLSYVGSADFTIGTQLDVATRLDVPDTADVNGNGLCSNTQRCPMGTEDVPDWSGFSRLSLGPNQVMPRRTEITLPRVPAAVDNVLVAGLLMDPVRGALPIGFASKTPGAPMDSTRPVEPVVLRTGLPFAGLETAPAGVWTIALSTRSTAESGRVLRLPPVLPLKVAAQPFLPLAASGAYAPSTRTWTPGNAEWTSLYTSGAEVGRVGVTGSAVRHTMYFPVTLGQTSVVLPQPPAGPGADPGQEGMVDLDVVAVDLADTVPWDEVISFEGVNLSSWNVAIDGYSRVDR